MSVILVNAEAGKIPLPCGVVHCSVSSPPYYSLRAYQGDQARDWPRVEYKAQPGRRYTIIPPMHCALGHEPTPEAFIGHLVACYREVYRVLRDDGVCWIIIGDCYGHGTNAVRKEGGAKQQTNVGANTEARHGGDPGQLMLIPARLALALQADGWTVRNDNVWHKIAPMPESVQGTHWQRCRVKIKSKTLGNQKKCKFGQRAAIDGVWQGGTQWADCPGCPRCEKTGGYVLRRGSWRMTRAHEFILHLTKGMGYFSDGEAVREANQIGNSGWSKQRQKGVNTHQYIQGEDRKFALERNDKEWINQQDVSIMSGRNPRSVLMHPETLVALREDLSEEDRSYVISELQRRGLL